MPKKRRLVTGVNKALNVLLENIEDERVVTANDDDELELGKIPLISTQLKKALRIKDAGQVATHREALYNEIMKQNLRPEQIETLMFQLLDLIGHSLGLGTVADTNPEEVESDIEVEIDDEIDPMDDEDEVIDDELIDDTDIDDFSDEEIEESLEGILLGEEDEELIDDLDDLDDLS